MHNWLPICNCAPEGAVHNWVPRSKLVLFRSAIVGRACSAGLVGVAGLVMLIDCAAGLVGVAGLVVLVGLPVL